MQNKANFKNNRMDVNLIITRDYERKSNWTLGENKANQSQFVFFTAENAELAEQKNICVTYYLTKKYNPNLLSLRSLRTRRLIKTNPISNLTLLKWVIMRENALDIMASAIKNANLVGLNKNRKNRKKESNAAIYAFN